MAKTKTAAVKRATRQRRKWPNRADLAPWLQCYLDVCEQYPRAEKAGVKACVPLRQLAECGYEKASLARLQRLLGRMAQSEYEATGLLALTGARSVWICRTFVARISICKLTKRAAWRELATLLDQITNTDELLESLHSVLFSLPGGDPIAIASLYHSGLD